MTEYAKLLLAEQTSHTIEIREKATGKEGVANSCADGVELFYGNEDGSDDKTVSPEEFSRYFHIKFLEQTAKLMNFLIDFPVWICYNGTVKKAEPGPP